MILSLQNHDKFASVALFDTESHRVDWRTRATGEALLISGWIGKVANDEILFYKRDSKLRLFVRDREFDADQIEARLSQRGDQRRFELRSGSETILDTTYSSPQLSPPMNDVLSPGEDEENYDYALFLYNVLTSPERAALSAETWV